MTILMFDLNNIISPLQITWTNFFQVYFPDYALPETEIGVLSKSYIDDVSRIISSTPDE